jgi:hypothetical protein
LQAAFPSISFNVINLARGASDVVVAATCWYQYMPQVSTAPTATARKKEKRANQLSPCKQIVNANKVTLLSCRLQIGAWYW